MGDGYCSRFTCNRRTTCSNTDVGGLRDRYAVEPLAAEAVRVVGNPLGADPPVLHRGRGQGRPVAARLTPPTAPLAEPDRPGRSCN